NGECYAHVTAIIAGEVLMMLKSKLCLALAVLLCLPLYAQDQQSTFTIRVNTQLVVQTVSVTDKNGKPIEGLTQDDFIITEDNVPQTIGVFQFERFDDSAPPRSSPSAVDRGPAKLSESARIAPAPPGDSRFQDRRLLVLYFDMPTMGDADRYRA